MLRNVRCASAVLRVRALSQGAGSDYSPSLYRLFASGEHQQHKTSGVSSWGGFFGLPSLLYFLKPDGTDDGQDDSSANNYSMLGMQTKQRLFFNYEKRIRELSTTEKVFEYFSSIERDGVRYMSPGDLLRSVIAVYPPEGSSVERAGSLRGDVLASARERHARIRSTLTDESNILMELDVDGDGMISYPEYLLLLTLLSIPIQDVQTIIKVVDTDDNGEIDFQEFEVILEALQNKVKLNASGGWHFRYTSAPRGLLYSFFGQNLDKCINHEFLLGFLQRLQNDIIMLEFEYYDWQDNGYLLATDFARSLITSAAPMKVNKLLDRVDSMPDDLKEVKISREDWTAVAKIREHMHTLQVALQFFEQLKGRVTKQDFRHILQSVLKVDLRTEVIDIIGYMLGKNSGEALDTHLVLTTMGRHCLTTQNQSQQ